MGMTERDRKLLIIFAVVVLLGGYWFLILGGKRQAVADAEKAVQEAQTALDSAKASGTQGQIEKKRYPVSYARVLRMGKAIPTDADFPSLLVQVNDVSEDANVNFLSLTASEGTTDGGAQAGATGGTTTCEAEGAASESTGSTTTTGSSGTTGSTAAGPTGSTAQSGVGKARDKATDAQQASDTDSSRASSSSADFAVKCASSPTLTDVAAQTSGLRVFTYDFTFEGSFFDLYKVYNGLLDMVRVKNGRLKVTGRLLQINTITTSVKEFPQLTATVAMTGYALPVGATITAGATATGPAGTESVSTTAPAPSAPEPAAGGGAPPAAFVGVK